MTMAGNVGSGLNITEQLLKLLAEASLDRQAWEEILISVYGTDWYVPTRAEEIRALWQAGELGFEVEWVSESVLPGAWGGYPTGDNRILLNADRSRNL
jgi:hypothetical protein